MEQYPSVHVLVLGDVTRSPRIKNHAMSFAKEGFRVKFSGYKGKNSTDANEKNITFSYIPEPPAWLDHYLHRTLALILKVICQCYSTTDLGDFPLLCSLLPPCYKLSGRPFICPITSSSPPPPSCLVLRSI